MAEWHDAMEALMRDRERALLGYAYLVCGNATDAEDLVQDALVKTFSRPRPGLTALKAEAYVRRAITTTYVDRYRRRQRWNAVQHLFRPGDESAEAMPELDMEADIQAALALLPPRERACVVLRYFDDLTVPQIGRQLGIAGGSVKRYLADGIARLERSLGSLEDTYSDSRGTCFGSADSRPADSRPADSRPADFTPAEYPYGASRLDRA